MKNNITKLTAAAIVFVLLVGVCQIDATRAAFARTNKVVSTGLAALKEFVLDMKTREPEPPSAISPVDSSKQKVAFEGRSIMANVHTFSVEAKRDELQEFFDAEGIEWASTGDNSNTWYAKLDSGKSEMLAGLSKTAAGIKLTSSPGLMIREGEEGIIGIAGSEENDNIALALIATIPDNGESINLSFSFLSGQSGFEIPSIRIDKDEAVMFRLVTTASSPDEQAEQDDFHRQDYMLVLVRIRVFPQP